MRFALRRLGFFLLTLWAALTLNFVLPRLMPGNPALAIIGKLKGGTSPQALHVLEQQFGIGTHQNVVAQYFGYLGNVARFNFGNSLTTQTGTSVGRIILNAIPWTLGLVGVTTVLAFVLGTGIGIVAAWRRGTWLDSIMPPFFVILTVVPFFWLGLILILIFGVKLRVLPYFFSYTYTLTPSLSLSFIGNVLEHAILPAFALLITTIGTWILTMRNTMITTLAEDYVRMARAKGLPGRRVMLDYAARNAILPNLTGFAMSLGFVLGGAILVEYVFNYQGVGWLLLQAVQNTDYPLMQALFLLITVGVLLAILLSDLATAILDPRTRAAS
ncbi:MAG TPA: ABC transporter permease [Streptosporangiaceae bacterium]|jgi:peptide/nickel transport system permease protein|nr:ABC transporter permease [Streptosporangiaceae bacterium]